MMPLLKYLKTPKRFTLDDARAEKNLRKWVLNAGFLICNFVSEQTEQSCPLYLAINRFICNSNKSDLNL